jgi:hypothetical protein
VLAYQESSKITARNEVNLLSKNDPGPLGLEFLKDPVGIPGLRDSECVRNYVRTVEIVLEPQSSGIVLGKLQDVGEKYCKSELAKAVVAQLRGFGDQLPSVKDCRQHVYEFAMGKLDDKTAKEVASLKLDESVTVDDDHIIQKGEDGRIWWIDKNSYYYYAWTDMVWKFFHSPEEKDPQRVKGCDQFLRQYEYVLESQSEYILKSLHELKHFYAAMSICTTAKLCDAFVTCDAFNADVSNFLANWQEYFELWSAKERDSEYNRLQAFMSHCNSNDAFLEYSITQDKSRSLDIQGFLNIW